jgi:hypothetical protein
MKVWIASGNFHHKGGEVLAVCSSGELANRAIEITHRNERRRPSSGYDSYSVKAWEVDVLPEAKEKP